MKKEYDASIVSPIEEARVAIVHSAWHKEHLDRMVQVSKEILETAKCQTIDVFQVPGTYEIPLTAKKLAKIGKYDAIIVYGIVLKGDTDHYEVILQTVIRELGKVMYDYEVPIIMEILPVHRIEDAIARSTGDGNKGIEAAQATIDLLQLYKTLATTHGKSKGEKAEKSHKRKK
ncbi:MAG TPA: 6,7-dimethyl-8-ribityllumazine synthase [Oculatellaceae cyanobacterium]